MSESGDQCALGPDGQLLPANKITWYNDPDDTAPISASTPTASIPPSQASGVHNPKPTDLRKFFSGSTSHAPATIVGGHRRSNRVVKPSKRALDARDGSGPSAPPKKARSSRSKVVQSEEPESDNSDSGDTEADSTAGDESSVSMQASFAEIQGMADQDRENLTSSRTKSERTADVRLIFNREKRLNPDTGSTEDGYTCTVCVKKGIVGKHCFFKGSITTLRNHIARNNDHVHLYTQRCKEKNITPNERVYSKTESAEDISGLAQGTLDGVVNRQPRFTKAGLLDYIVELVVREDEAFQIVDKEAFRNILFYLRPALADKDVPHRTSLRSEIMNRAGMVEGRIEASFKDQPGKISFTFDTWTSEAGDPYFSVTGHYIASPDDTPTRWELKSDQLAFTRIEGNHSGANLGAIIVRTVDRYDIRKKMGWFTADNASNNFSAIREVGHLVKDDVPDFDPKQRYVRCMEHSVDLSAAHFIKIVSPSSTRTLIKKIKAAFNNPDATDTSDLDKLENHFAQFDFQVNIDELEEEDLIEAGFDTGFDVADAVGKALALVKQIRASPQARAFFKSACTHVEVPYLQLILWVKTRWASLFAFLDRTLRLRKPLTHFAQYADESDEVPTLKTRNYSDFFLRKKDWEKLELMHEVLQEPASAKQTFSSSQHPTVFRAIPVLEFLKERWEGMSTQPKFMEVKDALNAGIANLDKWYGKVNDTDVYFICLALNPNFKTGYAESRWNTEAYEAGISRFEEVFDAYHSDSQPTVSAPIAAQITTSSSASAQYGYSWMRAAVHARQQAERAASVSNPRDELHSYLNSPLEEVENVIGWWGNHSQQYPTVSRIARDYLAIQGSATPSERAFSSGGITGTAKRNRLTPHVFEALQILKSAYRNGRISAEDEAIQHALILDDDLSDLALFIPPEGSSLAAVDKGKRREVNFEMLD